MSSEEDLARMVSAIVPGEAADQAEALAHGVKLGTMWAGIYRGLTQNGVPAGMAVEVVKTVVSTVLQPRK
ncbi:hypothetical protein [Rhodococcus pyridinivorans]|uniref:hypothetical protein n=1 Tax=Rhodococcus pyridinivorans TaxID=103816 RepID=UPI003AAE1C04